MPTPTPEEDILRSVALQNANSILRARRRAEDELVEAREELRAANERMRQVLDSITDGFVVLDSEWRFSFMNRRAIEILRPFDQASHGLIGAVLWESIPHLAGTEFERAYRRAREEQVTVEAEAFYAPLDRWFAVRAYPSQHGLAVYFQDVTRRKDAEAALEAEKKVLELIASGAALDLVLDRIAREVERRSSDGLWCSILTLDEAGERLLHGAAPSLPAAYNEAIHGIRIGPGVGSCGTAAFEGRYVEVADIATDPRWADFKDLAAAHGLGACCSTPILSTQGKVLGTIAMYYRLARAPSARDRDSIALAAHLSSIAIERDRAAEALRSGEERLRATFDQAAVGIAIADADGTFVDMNRKFCRILGYSAAQLRRMTSEDITHPDDVAATVEAMKQVRSGEVRDYALEKRYVRGDGSIVWGLATVTMLRDASGHAGKYIGVIEDISHRKETEAALVRSEQFNRGIIDSSQDCIKTLTLDGVLVWMSDKGRRLLRLDNPAELIGKSWIEFWKGDDRANALAAVRAAADGGSGSFVGRYDVAGAERWWHVVVSPVRDAAGKAESLLAVSRDVTDAMAAQRQLRESEEQLRHLANTIPNLAWMAEPDGNIFWYNQGWYEYTGASLEEMQGWGWKSVHDPEMLPRVVERWTQSIRSGAPFEMEFPLRGADGVFRWFLTRVNPLRDSSGRVVRWFGTNTNVDQEKRIRHALEEETRLLEVLNRTGTALASNLELQVLLQSITDAATQLSGAQFGAFFYNVVDDRGEAYQLYTLSGAPRAAFEKFGHPRATPVFAPTFRGDAIIRSADITKDPRYGQWGPHHGMPAGHLPVRSYLAVPVAARSGEVIGGLFLGHSTPGVFTERTERLIASVGAQAAVAVDNARLYEAAQKSSEERKQLLESERHARNSAEHASRMKDDFLATLSHELRTPLSAILGWSQLLRMKQPSADDLRRGLETIERNARMQTKLIEDLLDMSRITSGKVRLDVQTLQPVTFVEAALETVRPAAEAKGIRVESMLDPGAGPVYADPARMQQVVWNLLTNAIKFTPKDGKVQVALTAVNSHIEISVSDTGTGIDPQFIDHVFERFRQADPSTTRQFGGLGLGLAIVKNLAELHGGTVAAESAGAGRGATFRVSLPIAIVKRRVGMEIVHPRMPDAVAVELKPVDLSGLRIVVVDDQPDARELVSRVLIECKAQVSSASTALEALALIERERPDVLVSDIGMPDVDGFELIRRVRALPEERGGRIPAIALTAFARSEDRTRALHSGFQVHVSKPVEPAELIASVASVAGRTGSQER